MAVTWHRWLAGLALAAGLAGPAAAGDKPVFSPGKVHGCPAPSYSALHYWAPTLYRVRAWLNPNQPPSPYPPNRHPDLPASFFIQKYPCPAVDPAVQYPRFSTPPPRPVGETEKKDTGAVPEGSPLSGKEPKGDS